MSYNQSKHKISNKINKNKKEWIKINNSAYKLKINCNKYVKFLLRLLIKK